MNCEEARELIGADPDTLTPELQAHMTDCNACEDYRKEMLALNAKIRRALEVDLGAFQRAAPPGTPPAGVSQADTSTSANTPPAERSNVTPFRRRGVDPAAAKPTRSRGLPIAASLAAGVLVALTLWLSRPPASLAAEVVTHVEGEPNSWDKTEAVTPERLESVLHKSGVRMAAGAQQIVYANSCYFRGHFVPHFVVMTSAGPVTVMVLQHEQVSAKQQFNEAGYSGLIVPAPKGSVAVISRTPMSLDQPAAQMVDALEAAAARQTKE